VGVFDTGRDGDTRFIVMEFVAGSTLAQLLSSGQLLSVTRAVQIAAQIAGSLDRAHRAGIIHRDIKPGNVMVDATGTVKVLDFGIARALADTSLTQTAVVLGSAPYLAPEVARGAPADERSDVYSLGCLLYELLTGRPPFTGDVAAAILYQHNHARPQPPRELNPQVPAALNALVLRTLSKRPEERPQTAGQLKAELQRSLRPTAASPASGLVPFRRGAEAPTEPTRRLKATRRRPHTGRLIAIALVALLVGGLLAALLGSSAPPAHRASVRHAGARKIHRHTTPATTPRTSRSPAVSTPATTSHTTPVTTARSPRTPPTVPAAAGALTTLITQDLQSGAIDQHGQDLLNQLQDVLKSYEQGHPDTPHKVDDLTKHLSDMSRHGDIQPSALPAITAAIAQLRAAILQGGPASGAAAPPGPHPPPKKH
jgi:serine/threonine-protein kinase